MKKQRQKNHTHRAGQVALAKQRQQIIRDEKPQRSHHTAQPGPGGAKADVQPGQRPQKADQSHKNQISVQRVSPRQKLAEGHKIGGQRRPIPQQLHAVVPHGVQLRPPIARQNGFIHEIAPVHMVHGIRAAGIHAAPRHRQHHKDRDGQIAHRGQEKQDIGWSDSFQWDRLLTTQWNSAPRR